MIRWKAQGRWIGREDRPSVMGILNVTPDSFSDGGRFETLTTALAQADRLVAEGADLIDIGGESSRPGSQPVALAEELDRVIPVVERLARRVEVPLSVDTTKPEVARAAIEAGASIINDIGGLADPEMLRVVAGSEVGVVIMHMRGTPRTMQDAPEYSNVVEEVEAYLADRVRCVELSGIGRDRIAIDPGVGFGKSFDHNIQLLRRLPRFERIGCPILVGTSRKGFLGKITGRSIAERESASVASALAASTRGASIVRVHDVAATVDALRVWGAQNGWD